MIPLNPSSSLRTPVRIFGESVAGISAIIESGDGDVRGHHGIGAALDRGAEGRPLDLLEPLPVAADASRDSDAYP